MLQLMINYQCDGKSDLIIVFNLLISIWKVFEQYQTVLHNCFNVTSYGNLSLWCRDECIFNLNIELILIWEGNVHICIYKCICIIDWIMTRPICWINLKQSSKKQTCPQINVPEPISRYSSITVVIYVNKAELAVWIITEILNQFAFFYENINH